jgi:triosephosphate isomerase
MNKSIEETVLFIQTLAPQITEYNVNVYLAVPFTAISSAAKAAEKTKIIIGAQNMNDAKKGAFTGEIAGVMLKDAGAEFVILGHSERRHIFHENDEFINKKVLRALKDDIQPILCIGETEEERQGNKTEEVLERQLTKCLKGVPEEDAENLIIAYEPVWAIGSGKVATPEIAEKAHNFIRHTLAKLFENVAQKIYILYGGSVKPENISALMKKKDVEGALVGGASLEVESFIELIKNC